VIITSRKTKAPAIDSTLVARRDEEPVEEESVEDEGLEENLPPSNALKAGNTTSTDPIQNDPLPVTVTPAATASTVEPPRATAEEPPTEKADSASVAAPPAKKAGRPARSFALAPGHYVVAGAFRIMDNAIRYSQELHGKGYGDATIAINPKNNLYYVYIFASYDLDEARKIRNQYRVRRPFHEVWLFTME
jgi:cell division septation protein DedD